MLPSRPSPASSPSPAAPLTGVGEAVLALRRAASMGDLATVQQRLQGLPSPLPVDDLGCGVLRDAVEGGNPAVIRALVAHGEPVNHAARDGWTALMHAAAMGRLASTRALLEAGAAMDLKELGFHQSALHLAADNNQLGTALLLIEAGAPLDLLDRNLDSPYDLAVGNGFRRMADLLGAARSMQERTVLDEVADDLPLEDDGSGDRERRRL